MGSWVSKSSLLRSWVINLESLCLVCGMVDNNSTYLLGLLWRLNKLLCLIHLKHQLWCNVNNLTTQMREYRNLFKLNESMVYVNYKQCTQWLKLYFIAIFIASRNIKGKKWEKVTKEDEEERRKKWHTIYAFYSTLSPSLTSLSATLFIQVTLHYILKSQNNYINRSS